MKRRKFIGLSSLILFSPKIYSQNIFFNKMNKTLDDDFPNFNLSKIPFSYAGSFHVINQPENKKRLKLNTANRSAIPFKWQQGWAFEAYDFAICKGDEELEFTVTASPWELKLKSVNASANIIFYDKNTLAVFTQNCFLKLIPARNFSWKYPQTEGFVTFDNQTQKYSNVSTYFETPIILYKQQEIVEGAKVEMRDYFKFEENSTVLLRMLADELPFNPDRKTYEELFILRKKEVLLWMAKKPHVKKEHESAAKIGWFLFWNLQVEPVGNYTRQIILSSKKSMNMIWSWDNCFNALAIVKADHKLAWDQLFAILDKQKENGLLPDAVNDLMSTYGFNKPPVWGWTVMKMLESTPKSHWTKYLSEFYPKVVKFTNWWFQNRDFNKNGVLEYAHGNDSGWDNSTIFDAKLPTESPDLTTYIILQLDALSFIANFLGKAEEAKRWSKLSSDQLKVFHNTFIQDNEIVYQILTKNGLEKRKSTSLITRVCILLGKKLDPVVSEKIVSELKLENNFLTKNGLASEAVNSAYYESNGYWRGPVWAPSTYLIFDGLLKCGEIELARTIAQRFCDMVSKDATFSENYDALTGKGQYDSGLTWTSSDFILMAGWLADNVK